MAIEQMIITVMSGVDDGKMFELDKDNAVLGRHPDDDVLLPYDTRVSRHHARITSEGGSHFIEDIGPAGKGSTNGTYINNSRITDKVAITSGEIIQIGSVTVKFELKSPTHS